MIKNKDRDSGVEKNSKEYVDLIDDMLLDDDYCFAEKTLIGIRDWAEQAGFCTEAQKKTILKIYESKEK